MAVRILSSIALIWSLPITVQSKKGCYDVKNVKGLLKEDTELVCNISRNCTRASWKRHSGERKTDWASEQCEGSSQQCSISNNATHGVNILHIHNLSESMTGVYKCRCERKIGEIQARPITCYNLTVYSLECSMKTVIEGKRTMVYKASHLYDRVETINATTGDVLKVKCLNGEQKNTNCSDLDYPSYDIQLRLSDTWCHFSCVKTANNATCEVSIILIITERLLSSISNKVMASTIPTAMILSSTMDSSFASETSKNLYITNTFVTTSELEGTLSTVSSHSDHKSVPHRRYESSSKLLKTDMWTIYGTQRMEVTNLTDARSVYSTTSLVYFVSVIFLLSAVIILQFTWIIFTRKKFTMMSSSKEIWLNPIYESADNDLTAQNETENMNDGAINDMTLDHQSHRCLGVTGPQKETSNISDFSEINELVQYTTLKSENYKDGKSRNGRESSALNNASPNLAKMIQNTFQPEVNINDESCNNSVFFFKETVVVHNERIEDNVDHRGSEHIYDSVDIVEKI